VRTTIPYHEVTWSGREIEYLQQCLTSMHVHGDGPFTHRCEEILAKRLGSDRALLTTSGTDAIELASLLLDIQPGDEVILPSFTFVSTANPFVLRGAVAVFVDIRPDTLNLDETKLEAAITSRTKVIVPVHYAGISCEMDTIMEIAHRHGIAVVEDAAHGYLCEYKGKMLGSIGDMGVLSFHQTKTIAAGEGGVLLLNQDRFGTRAEILREKGTNRKQFFRGEVDKYTWCDIGSSFLPSDLIAAVLQAQLEVADSLLAKRRTLFSRYMELLAPLQRAGFLQLPTVPPETVGSGHIFYLLLPSATTVSGLKKALSEKGIASSSHYVPLHSSPAGMKWGRKAGDLSVTDRIANTILRIPIYPNLQAEDVEYVCQSISDFFHQV
jgi:dTDP-4-amino-4,6-dideoxygalactose transaminase